VAPEFPPATGGVQTYAWNIANELTRLGHTVTVFAPPDTHRGENVAAPFRIERVLGLRRSSDRAILREHKMDVWHCLNAPQAWLALETAPVFVTVYGNDFVSPYHQVVRLDLGFSDRFDHWLARLRTRRLMSRALPRAHHVFAISRYTEEIFLAHHPACRGKTSVASVGIADEDFALHETPRADGPARLITICRLHQRRKNLRAVLQALSRLRAEYDFRYTIVGDGRLRPELEALAETLDLTDRVTFTGFVDREHKLDLLRASDLFVLAALSTARSFEGFGLVYLEANACGTPVLAARVAGAIEAVEEGVSGYFVDEPTSEGIAGALSSFFGGDLSFEAEACQRFARRFSWREVAQHCIDCYREALGG
jgi:phosphatidyl-myo-inositol dimannoside synthase